MKPLEAFKKGYGLKEVMLGIEREVILLLFKKHQGNLRKVAEDCLIGVAHLKRKCERLGIDLEKI